MVREDLVDSAVSFLQDPSVAAAPLEQRIAFLRSKNLTQDEVDLSLQRAASESAPPPHPTTTTTSYPPVQPSQTYSQQPQSYYPPQQAPPYPYQNAANQYWHQPPPPDLPRRDWRDWFIMATVLGGVGFGAYSLAKRYVYPLIAPPTPPQLEQDKAAVDAKFDKAFALLEQLAADTEALKTSEQERTERLDSTLDDVDSVIARMSEANARRDDEGRRISDQVCVLKDMIPKAMESQKEAQDQRLKDLANEMKSLKTLLNNRMSQPPTNSTYSSATVRPFPTTGPRPNSAATTEPENSDSTPQPETKPSPVPDRSMSSSPYGRVMNGRAAIPAWQMAAAKKSQEAKEKSGTVEPTPAAADETPPVDGATA